MRKLLLLGLLCSAIFLFTSQKLMANSSINSAATITWPFNLGTSGQVATYTTGTEGYFSTNWVENGSNLTLKDKSINYNITYTRFQPVTQSNSVTANDNVSFCVRPKTGLIFAPTQITFDCMRYGTSGGLIDVVWKSGNGTLTTIATGVVPARDNAGAGTHYTVNVSSLNIPNTTGDCTLLLYIYTLGNTKQVGISNVVIDGTVSGTIIDIPAHNVTTSVFPTGAGTIASVPVGTSFDEGTAITLTASRNFGYSFKEWRDANNDTLISTANPLKFTLKKDAPIKAVFNTLNTYSLTLNVEGGGKPHMVAIAPAGTVVNSQTMYEEGTQVTLTASNNQVLTFTNWLTGETNPVLTVPMTKNQTVTATYSAADYIAGWDLYKAGGSSRPADFASSTDNETATLVLRKTDGTVSSWLDKSMVAAAGYYNRGAAVNWKPMADQYYYQISFNATNYTNIKVSAGLLYNYNAYTIQKFEYSLDGTNFTALGNDTLTAGQTWFDKTFALPVAADHAPAVYVRFIPDYTSAIAGTTAAANDGTAISNIYVTATAATYNDGVAPVLSSSVPANSSTGASTTGKVVLNFDEKIQIVSGTTATLGGKTVTPSITGKTITFPYTGLEYNTAYTFTLSGNKVSDLGGNLLTTPISISFTTMNRPTVTKKSFDFVVGVDGDFKAALNAATVVSSSGERFRIFFPNGNYNIGANTGDANQKTVIALPNVSYIGQSSDGVVLFNKNTTEGIGSTATINFTNTANNLYLQDLSLKNSDYRSGVSSIGRCVALQDQGTKNIYKNVNVLSNQDTYYSGSGRLYFEGGSLHGTVDFLCGGGDVFFNESLLYLEDRSGNCITAPATSSNWGYVFSNCTIDGFASTNGNYNLGRPWQNSPKSIYINTKMNVLASSAGWTEMGVVPGLFAEYGSVTGSGTPVDVSMRKKSFTYNGVTTPVNPYLTAEQAATYTVENVLGGTDNWLPRLYTDQAATPVITGSGKTINWADNNYVLCWAIFKDGVFVTFVTANSYTIPANVTTGIYTVRAANEMGGLGVVSNGYSYSQTNGVQTNLYSATVVNQSYYTISGERLNTLDNYVGVAIVRTSFSDGRIVATKVIRTFKQKQE